MLAGRRRRRTTSMRTSVNAIWKLGGESLAHCRALLDMLRDGYTGQTWPTMRAIHESNRLLGAVVDPEELDLPGLKTVEGIAEVEGNYPSKGGKGERAASFRDSEGNMLGIGQPIY
jgi:hypothetical protein